MKRLFFFALAAGLFACNAGDTKVANAGAHDGAKPVTDSAAFTTVEWIDSTTQNLGTLTEGQVVEISWRFKNTGDKPLVIENVQAACGCTVPEKPDEPIAPGGEGVIKAKFDSKGRPGHADKYVTVSANLKNHNSGGSTMLRFSADVK